MLSIPRAAERALAGDFERVVGGDDVALGDVDTVLVLEGRVSTLPRCDTTTTASELDVGICDPARAKAIEEVRLATYDRLVHVSIAELADVDLTYAD